MSNTTESVILSLHPAPPGCPLRVLSIVDIDGWISGWAEPVIMVALVETRYYICDVDEVPRDPIERQAYLDDCERAIEPVIYDGNATTGLSTWSDLTAMSSSNESLHVIRDDISWEDLARPVESHVQSMHRWHPRQVEAVR